MMVILLRGAGMRNPVVEDFLAGLDWSCSLRPWWHINFVMHNKVLKSVVKTFDRTASFLIINITFIDPIFF